MFAHRANSVQRYEHNKSNAQKIDTKLVFPLQLDMTPYTTRAHRLRRKNLPPGVDPADLPATPPPSHSSAASSPNAAAASAQYGAGGLTTGSNPFCPRSHGWYDLATVVVHVGKMDAGHYLCYCRRDDQWFKFDDSKVTLADERHVLEADAYLLFYVVRSLGSSGSFGSGGSVGGADTKEVGGGVDEKDGADDS